MDTLFGIDEEINLENIKRNDIINSITLQDVKIFLESLGVDQIVVNEEKQYLICPTICHNPLHEAESMKLYWYQNNKIFRCYTECNEAMSIFKLYQKFIYENEHREASNIEAEDYVKHCLKHIISMPKQKKDFFDFEKYKFSKTIPLLQEYSENVLDCFSKYYPKCWLKEGITKEAMDRFKIRFSYGQNKIIIPHYDINGRLVGIRARVLDTEEIQNYGKYRPIQVGDIIYTHQLQFNLYGIYEHKEGIKMRRQAIIAEAEKSVLLDEGYYNKYSNCVACCGSTFNKYHISLLTDILGANEIVVALDKEYNNSNSEKAYQYRKKIEKLCERYKNQANFSYIWDYDNLLEEKDSPFDKGKEIFDYLYKNRVKLR